MKKLIISILTIASFTSPAFAKQKKAKSLHQEIYGVVHHCHDGDTCTVMAENQKVKVRFAGIDAPELKQENGKAAQNFTEGLLKNKDVKLDCEGTSYDRLTCTVFLNDEDINAKIVRNGFAYDVPKYSQGKYREAMLSAKNEQLGLWKSAPQESPFCYRHAKDKRCLRDRFYIER
jgi:micrococcal nuclease